MMYNLAKCYMYGWMVLCDEIIVLQIRIPLFPTKLIFYKIY